jgi:hypothetical protein
MGRELVFGVPPNPGDPCHTAARMRRSETERITGMDCGNKCPNTAASTELDRRRVVSAETAMSPGGLVPACKSGPMSVRLGGLAPCQSSLSGRRLTKQ